MAILVAALRRVAPLAAGRHRRSTPLIRLLARLGWQRDPAMWTVPCRDVDGRRARLLIRLSPSGITITTTAAGPLRLTGQQVVQLLMATRDGLNMFGLLADREHAESPRESWRAEAPTAPLDCPGAQREVVLFERPPRPTVRELRARLGTPPASTVAGDTASQVSLPLAVQGARCRQRWVRAVLLGWPGRKPHELDA